MNIFEYAMQMEKDGEDYYRQLAQQTDNKDLKTILTMLADEEAKHYITIEEMKDEKPQLTETTVLLTDAKNVFVQIKEMGEEFDFGIGQTELYKKPRISKRKVRISTSKRLTKLKKNTKKRFS